MSAFAEEDDQIYAEEEQPVMAVPAGGEDWDGAADAKDKASEAKANNNYDQAVAFFTEAMEKGGSSAMTLANRADCLLKLKRPLAALNDCEEALKINPDSAKALRCHGVTCRHLGRYEEANKSLSKAQSADFNPDTEEMRQFVCAKVALIESDRTKQRLVDEDILREKVKKQREEIAKQRKEEEEKAAAEEAERAARGGGMGGMPGGMGGMPGGMGGMPGGMGGMPGGMPGGMGGGMPGMGGEGGGEGGMGGEGGGEGGMGGMQQMIMQMLMSDPELAAGLQNPKIIKAFTAMMGGGGEVSPEEMEDPEVKKFMEKFQEKMGPLMGMMGGGGGGMPGMGGMGGGMPGGMGGMGGMGGGMPSMPEEPEEEPQVEEVD